MAPITRRAAALAKTALVLAATVAEKNKEHTTPHVQPGDPMFAYYILAVIVLVILAGIFSGLTIGLMALDMINLQVISQAGTPEQQEQAIKVLGLLSKGRHLVLVVLLLGNTLVNTSLPVFLDSMVGGGVIAILGSTALELIFGEIFPQAICNRYGLAIGATCAPLVKGFIILMYPIAKPIAMLLDYLFGAHDEGSRYRKAELKTFVTLGVADKLAEDEIDLLGSVLEFSGKVVEDIMTPLEDVYQLSAEKIVDDELVAEILRKGHSRIPVHEPSSPGAFIGVMTVRALVGYDPSDLRPASSLITQVLPQCPLDLSLQQAMNYFQTGRSHILLVSSRPGKDQGAVGIVTLEDVVEELIGKEIIDETDQYVDIHSKIHVVRPRAKDHPAGLKRIYEGRLARRRILDERKAERAAASVTVGSLIDHPINAGNTDAGTQEAPASASERAEES